MGLLRGSACRMILAQQIQAIVKVTFEGPRRSRVAAVANIVADFNELSSVVRRGRLPLQIVQRQRAEGVNCHASV
ncbi:MAG: hypothetical protein K2X34_10625 [Hyphomonadaceae bacterium]|nr:hypothetical protein [Hyphomonadaceae bacterium]